MNMNMKLNIGGSGKSKPYVKYNAKADKWFIRGPDGEDVEIQRPNFVTDFDNIATGWLLFREGQGPERVMDPSIDRPAPLPGEGFKRGFVVMVFSPKSFGGSVEFSSASIHLANAINELFAEYMVKRTANPGKLPVVSCTGSQAMKDRYGTNYRPTFAITKWLDRPVDLPNVSPVAASEVWHGNAAPTAAAKPAAQLAPYHSSKTTTDPDEETDF